MARNANINIRTDVEIKAMAEALYASFGITLSDAINMFLNKSIMEGGLPFELKQPKFNAVTEAAIAEADAIIEGRMPAKRYKNMKEVWADIEEDE
ncbi:MAG: type II toxin-antitoxin system RelB/DinJ family antitoxin [Mogibacterium sp.]|nr:type II toxin-antitoxin system RelB/DinJ family antitoxin [Mogibacterium sp.]